MNNDEMIYVYKNIVEQLKNINRRIEKLDTNISNLKSLTKKTLLINNQIYNSVKFEKVNNILVNSSKVINERIIPSLLNKIYN